MPIPTYLTTIQGAAAIVNVDDYDPRRYGPILAHDPGQPGERSLVAWDIRGPDGSWRVVDPVAPGGNLETESVLVVPQKRGRPRKVE